MSENGEIYTADKNFTLPPAVTALTNSTSAQPHAASWLGNLANDDWDGLDDDTDGESCRKEMHLIF